MTLSLTSLDSVTLDRIMQYLCGDFADHTDEYVYWHARYIASIGRVNKSLYAYTRTRDFLENFYYRLFPTITIPKDSLHTDDGCPLKSWAGPRMNEFGVISPRNSLGGLTQQSREKCQNPAHYASIKTRKRTCKFKDMMTACRKRYITFGIENNKPGNRVQFSVKREINRLKCELAKQRRLMKVCKRKDRFRKLREHYQTEDARKTKPAN